MDLAGKEKENRLFRWTGDQVGMRTGGLEGSTGGEDRNWGTFLNDIETSYSENPWNLKGKNLSDGGDRARTSYLL